MAQRNSISRYLYALALVALFASCDKVDITFGASSTDSDPNITYFDNYQTTIATYKPDSFLTGGHKVFSVGYHYDTAFGAVKMGSFAEISLPSTNPLANRPVVFDSLELIVKPTGTFFGDSTRSMKLNIYRLTDNIVDRNTYTDTYYNTSSFGYSPTPIGQQVINLNNKSGTAVHIRLSDALGQELLTKFKNNDDVVSSSEKFVDYFRGIYINTDSVVTNTIAFLNASADSMLIRLTYHENTLYPETKLFDFIYNSTKQFNNVSLRYTNPALSSFIPNKAQLVESTVSGNQAFLNSTIGSSVKISFPTLLNLKELHPYIKVVKAILVVKPDVKSLQFPYVLPSTLNLYTTDQTNGITGTIFEPTSSGTPQTGNLVIDYLYGENTYYSYDITSFINTKMTEGQFSKAALLLSTTLSSQDVGVQRLIVNNQSNARAIELKLYVLGL
ncbi:hypothetical protein [Ferruginibacter sp.]